MKPLLYFLKKFKAYKKLILLGLILSLLAAVSGIALLALSGWFISISAFMGLSVSTALAFNFFVPSAGVRFFALLRIVSRYAERIVTHDATFRLLTDLRVWFYEKLLPLAPNCFLKFKQGDLLNRALLDIDHLNNLYLRVFSPTLIMILVWILVGVFINFFNSKLAIFVLIILGFSCFIPPLISNLLGKKIGQYLSEQFSSTRSHWVTESDFITESILFNRQNKVINYLTQEDFKLRKLQFKMACITGLVSFLMLFLSGIAVLGVLILGSNLIIHHQLNGANLALLALAVLGAFEIANSLPIAYQYLGQTAQAAKRIKNITDQQPEIIFPKSKSIDPNLDQNLNNKIILSISNLNFNYKQKTIFKDFNLNLKPREKIAIMGETGSGKSTLVNILARFINVKSGEIKLNNLNLLDYDEKSLRENISILLQKPIIFSGSVKDNLTLGVKEIENTQLWNALKAVDLESLIQGFENKLDTLLGEGGRGLSGGQMKRLALARLLLTDSDLWVLDEPFEGVDFKTREFISKALEPYIKNKALILISHQKSDQQLFNISQCIKLG